MANIEDKTAIHIKDARGWYRQLVLMMGVACGLFGPITICRAIAADWGSAACCGGIIFGLACLLWFYNRLVPEDVAILLPDGVVLPGSKMHPKFQWSEVESIWWPRRRDKMSHHVRLSLAKNRGAFCRYIPLHANSISPADRLMLIRYLRLVGSNIPQKNWPTFCDWYAVRTIEQCQKKLAQGMLDMMPEGAPQSWAGTLLRRFVSIGRWSPFLLGMLIVLMFPLVCPLFLVSVVSRRTWWIVSVLLGVSVAINLPLLFGWNLHVAILLTVITLVPAVLGLFAMPVGKTLSNPEHVRGGMAGVAVVILGLPFLAAAGVHGWIPALLGKYALMGLCLAICIPVVLFVYRRERLRDMEREERETAALQRWEAYENSMRSSEMLASE